MKTNVVRTEFDAIPMEVEVRVVVQFTEKGSWSTNVPSQKWYLYYSARVCVSMTDTVMEECQTIQVSELLVPQCTT